MAVRTLTQEDALSYREIRLDALRTDPEAFASTYEREVAFERADWERRLADTEDRPFCTFVDEVNGVAIGTAAIGYTEWDAVPMLVAMWVRPEARGTGSGRRLIDAAMAWAADRGEAEVVLWVVKDNQPAINLYTSCGFVPSGATDTLPSNPCAEELEMRRSIPGSTPRDNPEI